MPEPRSIDKIYNEAPSKAVNRLTAFRERHPSENVEVNGRIYAVHDMGSGKKTAVFLPGSLSCGEIYFPFMFELADHGRVIAISYSHVRDFETLADDIATILRERGVESCSVIGQSIGGFVAQILTRRHPSLVEGMGLLMTGAPAADLPAAIRRRWTKRARNAVRYYMVPFSTLSRSLALQMYESFCPPEYREGMLFWEGYFEDIFQNRMYRKLYLSINLYGVSRMYRKHRFKPDDLKDWGGRVVVYTSEDEKSFAGAETDCLVRLYPGAEVIDIGEGGQFAPQLHEREMLMRFMAFMGYERKPPRAVEISDSKAID